MKTNSLSTANQIIHEQRLHIDKLSAHIALLEMQIAEETKLRYAAWKKLADNSLLSEKR